MEDETPERLLRSLAGLKPSHYTTASCSSFVRIERSPGFSLGEGLHRESGGKTAALHMARMDGVARCG
jgi:hypothetical protein